MKRRSFLTASVLAGMAPLSRLAQADEPGTAAAKPGRWCQICLVSCRCERFRDSGYCPKYALRLTPNRTPRPSASICTGQPQDSIALLFQCPP